MKPEEFIAARLGEEREAVMIGLRAIMSIHKPLASSRFCGNCCTEGDGFRSVYPCETVEAIGDIWSEHPDYRRAFPPPDRVTLKVTEEEYDEAIFNIMRQFGFSLKDTEEIWREAPWLWKLLDGYAVE